MIAFLAVVVVAVLLALIYTSDIRKQRSVQRLMDGIVTRRGQDTLDEITLLVRENKHVLAAYHDNAQRSVREGQYDEAVKRMNLGIPMIEALAPDFVSALGALRRLGRSVSLIVSVEPVRGRAFQVWKLRGLAAVGEVVHYVLLTGRERILLRVRVVTAAFRLVLRWLRRSTRRVTSCPADLGEWRYIDALVSDFGTANDEAVVAAVQIVQALDAAELGSPLVHRVGP